MRRYRGLAFLGLLLLPVLIFVRGVLRHPEGFSRLFLKTGGRVVTMTTSNPRATAIVVAGMILVTWVMVISVCGLESWRERSRRN